MSHANEGRRRFLIGGAAGVASAALGLKPTRAWAADRERLVVVMDWLPSWKQAPFHLAKVRGWYGEAGLDVQIDDGSGSTVTIAQAANGNCDLGLASLSAMAVARSKGSEVVAVAHILRKNDVGMLVDRKLDLKHPNELGARNAKIFFESTSFQSLFPAFFKNLGVDVSQITLTPMSAASAIGTYVAGQGDALITTVPYAAPVVDAKRPSDAVMFADHGLPLPSHGLVASPTTLRDRGEAVRRFLAVTERAWQALWFGDPEEAIDALVGQRPHTRIDAGLELKRVAAYRPFAVTTPEDAKGLLWMAPAEWEQATSIMRETEIIRGSARATDFYTDAYVPTP